MERNVLTLRMSWEVGRIFLGGSVKIASNTKVSKKKRELKKKLRKRKMRANQSCNDEHEDTRFKGKLQTGNSKKLMEGLVRGQSETRVIETGRMTHSFRGEKRNTGLTTKRSLPENKKVVKVRDRGREKGSICINYFF